MVILLLSRFLCDKAPKWQYVQIKGEHTQEKEIPLQRVARVQNRGNWI